MSQVLEQIRDRVSRHAGTSALASFGCVMVERDRMPIETRCPPGLCLVLQGGKRMLVGNRALRFGAGQCFASLVELATTRHLVTKEGARPFLATTLVVDPAALAALLVGTVSPREPSSAFAVHRASPDLLEAWDRCIALLDAPDDIPVLGPLRERELLYRLLQGPTVRSCASSRATRAAWARSAGRSTGYASTTTSVCRRERSRRSPA